MESEKARISEQREKVEAEVRRLRELRREVEEGEER